MITTCFKVTVLAAVTIREFILVCAHFGFDYVFNCDTRDPGREVMLGVPSRPKASVTAPKPFPPRMLHQSVDTVDLEKGLKAVSYTHLTLPTKA